MIVRPTVDLRSARTVLRRNRELRATLAFSVDAGWADGLVVALDVIAKGCDDPALVAAQALVHAGLVHVNGGAPPKPHWGKRRVAPYVAQGRLDLGAGS